MPVRSADLYTHIDTILRAAVGTRAIVYLGHVPDSHPTIPDSNGLPRPYLVVWPSPGTAIDDEPVAGGPDLTGQHVRFTITAVAHDPTTVLRVLDDIRPQLTGCPVGDGIIRPDVEQQNSVRPLVDPDIRPARHYMPTDWWTQITRL
ncbi:hypothetical protein [Citricoccus sp. NR2]|uniref:hypothetical protein n=1 Tax=Citricoccus sp. NR2 TaxID=3004095 RepID=UPI0022DE8942|nr:hypothetical protein [Citricoccus sp. NR2]WBL18517.1 hypothetical protein O1A05_12220 [Citricoccus sp. NR2]